LVAAVETWVADLALVWSSASFWPSGLWESFDGVCSSLYAKKLEKWKVYSAQVFGDLSFTLNVSYQERNFLTTRIISITCPADCSLQAVMQLNTVLNYWNEYLHLFHSTFPKAMLGK